MSEKAQILTCSHHVQGITKMSKSRQRGPLSGESLWAPSLSEGKRPTDTRPALLTSSPSSPPQPPSTSTQLTFFVIGQQFKTKIFRTSSPFFNSTPLWWALFFGRFFSFSFVWYMDFAFGSTQWGATFGSTKWVANTIPDRDLLLRAIRCWWHFKDWVDLWKT